jgi:hypothetical protein
MHRPRTPSLTIRASLSALTTALLLAGCSINTNQFGTRQTKECGLWGTCAYTAERRINGRVRLFTGREQTPRAKAVSFGSVVRWTDTTTGATYLTRVPCVGGIIPSLFDDETQLFGDQCLDQVSSDDHAGQLPGD